MTKEYLEKRSGERNVDRQTDSRIQVQLEEDGGGSTRQSWMIETSGLVPPAASHAGLSIVRRLAVARPKLSGRRSSSTVLSQFSSVFQFFVASLWEDPECRPGELGSGLDRCRHGTDNQRRTSAVDRHWERQGISEESQTK